MGEVISNGMNISISHRETQCSCMYRITHREMLVGGHPFMERFPTSTMRCCVECKVAWRVAANSHRVRKMAVKSIALLLLCLTMEEVVGPPYKCQRPVPSNCMDNPRIRISKSNHKYQLRLCSNSQCISDAEDNNMWIKCSDICEVCPLLLSESG